MESYRRIRLPLFFIVVLAATALPILFSSFRSALPLRPLAGFRADDPTWSIPGEVVVDFRDDASPADILSAGRAFGLSFAPDEGALASLLRSNPARIFTASVPTAQIPALLVALRGDHRVEAAEPQHLFRVPDGEKMGPVAPRLVEAPREKGATWQPNDPRYAEQWNFRRIHTEEAWPTNHGRGVTVAVIDTGVAYADGPRGKRAKDFPETQFVEGYDFIHRDANPYDDHGHGTHVAGTIAETTNNKEGVAGIAFEAKIMPIKVLSAEGWGRMSDIAAGIRWAADHGANVINMSLGGPYPDSITRNACKYAVSKGVTIVCAAGNGGGEGVGYPAAYPECIAVSALGPKGELAPYSSWGAQVGISAPGGDKTQGEDAGILQNTVLEGQDDYYAFQGTSMASPHVAAVAALVAAEGVKDPEEVRAVLQKSAQARGPKEKYGAGEVDAAAAVRRADAEHSDYWGRVWLTGFVWAAALLLAGSTAGRQRRIGAAVAVTIGLFLPDLFGFFSGYGSLWNLVGHSVIIPLYLLVSETDGDKEARFYGVMALGSALHLVWDLYYGTAPFLGPASWITLPWLYANALLGLWAWKASRRGESDRAGSMGPAQFMAVGASLGRSLGQQSAGTGLDRQFHLNEHGDVLATSDSTQTTETTYQNDAFGKVLAGSATNNSYDYAADSGYWHDPDSGLVYVQQRWYDPNLGLWLSADPVDTEPRYDYCYNQPTVAVDPNGTMSEAEKARLYKLRRDWNAKVNAEPHLRWLLTMNLDLSSSEKARLRRIITQNRLEMDHISREISSLESKAFRESAEYVRVHAEDWAREQYRSQHKRALEEEYAKQFAEFSREAELRGPTRTFLGDLWGIFTASPFPPHWKERMTRGDGLVPAVNRAALNSVSLSSIMGGAAFSELAVSAPAVSRAVSGGLAAYQVNQGVSQAREGHGWDAAISFGFAGLAGYHAAAATPTGGPGIKSITDKVPYDAPVSPELKSQTLQEITTLRFRTKLARYNWWRRWQKLPEITVEQIKAAIEDTSFRETSMMRSNANIADPARNPGGEKYIVGGKARLGDGFLAWLSREISHHETLHLGQFEAEPGKDLGGPLLGRNWWRYEVPVSTFGTPHLTAGATAGGAGAVGLLGTGAYMWWDAERQSAQAQKSAEEAERRMESQRSTRRKRK